MKEELEIARALAIDAGGILLRHFERKTSVRWKGPGNPVTDADQEASRFIVEGLHQRFPHDGILCEEEADNSDRLQRSRVWIVDPMDGTAEFVAGRSEFAVMIGLAVDGRPRIGVVYLPVDKKLYYAEAGGGTYVEASSSRKQLHVSAEGDLGRATIAASRSHDSVVSQRIRDTLGIGNVLRVGGVGLKVAMICEGQAHLYIHAGSSTSQWDTCAPEIILHEAGGKITDVANRPLAYNTLDSRNPHGLIASNGALHDRAVAAVTHILSTN